MTQELIDAIKQYGLPAWAIVPRTSSRSSGFCTGSITHQTYELNRSRVFYHR